MIKKNNLVRVLERRSHRLGDRYLVDNIKAEVIYINQGFAWLGPIKDGEFYDNWTLLKNVAFIKIDQNNEDRTGKRYSKIK